MKLVMTTVLRGGPDLIDAHLAFHLNAGVDLIIAVDPGSSAPPDLLARYERGGRLQVTIDRESPTHLARLAATQHGADWVLASDATEFWWPRGESLKDVLAPIPERYAIVQGLRRDFVPAPGGGPFSERMTVRPSIERATDLTPVLRPVFRADPEVIVEPEGGVKLSRGVPLRAWYPIEVLYFPIDDGRAVHLDDSVLVEDTRLRGALRNLRSGETGLSFRVPDIVEDARYAVECAAVGEVDLPRLEQYLTELEQRVDWLEQRLWPRVLRRIARLVGRPT